jgi:hypothetical protein
VNKLLKNSSLALILLITTFQIKPNNPPSYWQIFITFFYENPQQQENPNQAPAGVTEDHYIAQFYSDMNGRSCIIPLHEMQEMETAIRQELRNIDLRDKDEANRIIRKVLRNQGKIGSKRDLYDLEHREGFYVSTEEYETIPNSYKKNISARLNRMRHLNGEALAQYYGETRKESIRNGLKSRTSYR